MEGRNTLKKSQILMVAFVVMTTSRSSAEIVPTAPPEDVLNQFIYIPGMRMREYNFWLPTENVEDCAIYCLDEDRIHCKSFSYSHSAAGCGTYEKSRADAPSSVYIEQFNPLAQDGVTPSWRYYERKSKEYIILEGKMIRLQNLTEINVTEASEVLSEFRNRLRIESETEGSGTEGSGTEGSGTEATVSPGELDLMAQILKIVVDMNPIANASPEVSEKFTKVLVNVTGSMMQPAHAQSWRALQRDPTTDGIAGIVTSSEVVGRDVSKRLLHYHNSTSIIAEAKNTGMWLDIVQFPELNVREILPWFLRNRTLPRSERSRRRKARNPDDVMYVFPPKAQKNSKGNDSVLAGDVIMLPQQALRNRSVVTHVRYKGLADVIPAKDINIRNPPNGTTFSVKSAVLTTSVYPKPAKHIFKEDPVVIIFAHPPNDDSKHLEATPPEDSKNSSASPVETTKTSETIVTTTHCVFWHERDETSNGGWSRDGCFLVSTNATHTVCNCRHLTSFAVLLKMVDTTVEDSSYLIHNRALSYISYIGCALSLAGVVLMCGAFIMLKFHTENMKIHFNLGVAVGAADLVFMFEKLAQQQKYSCVLVIVLLYYFNMAVLSWMLIEGLFLYSQVVVVFVSARRWVKYYVIAGWAIPAIVMGISMGILNVQLGTKEICWLSPADNSIWAFAAPAILVIVINFVILVSVVRVIVGIQPDQTNNVRVSKVKNAVKGSIFLSPLLGTTWLFGFLSLSHETLLFQYIFASTNSLQGFFLFVFHCVCNSEVRADLARRRNRKPSTSSRNSSKSPPWFSGTFGLTMATGLKKFRNSISFDFSSSHSTSDNSQDGSDLKMTSKELPTAQCTNERTEAKTSERSEKKRINVERRRARRSKIPRINRARTGKSHLHSKKSRRSRKREKANSGQREKSVKTVEDSVTEDKSSAQEANATQSCKVPTNERVSDVTLVKWTQLPTLLSMPMKNDVIQASRGNKVVPLPSLAQRQTEQKPVNQTMNEHRSRGTNNEDQEFFKLSDLSMLPHVEWEDQKQDELNVERKKEANNIAMSYDSGLNSIDNESFFEDEDEYVEMPYGKYRVGIHGCDIAI